MKKLTVVLLLSVCFAILCSCQQKKQEQQEQQESLDTANPYFTGKVIEIEERGCLMEVTHTGNGNFYVGE
jgi:preprotein translocase subunit YajC